jgi:Ca2+:H+ antiporter
VIPAAYHGAKHTSRPRNAKQLMPTSAGPLIGNLDDNSQEGLLTISRGTAVLLLAVYIVYLVFQLKTHAYLFDKDPGHVRNGESIQDVEEEALGVNVIDHGGESIQDVEEDNLKMNVVAAGLWHVCTNNLVLMNLLRKSSVC